MASPITQTLPRTPASPRAQGQRDPHAWFRDLPSTQYTVAVGLVCALMYVTASVVGALVGKALDATTHVSLGAFILALCGLNFAVKRFTDEGYARAKASSGPQVSVENAARVSTQTTAQP
jgi:hypothetical protein